MEQILIIEDDPGIAAALEVRLRAAGYFPIIASDGVQGSRLAVQNDPGLIILDISLPAGSGLVVAERLKKLPETVATPIIFLTALKDPQLQQQALDLSPAALFEKPYEIDDLLAAVKAALAASPRRKTSGNGEHPRKKACKTAKKILIVEDDEHIAMALALRLKSAGYQTAVAFDAVLGLSSAVASAPDLVILDISMPGGTGLELMERLRGVMAHVPPIIFLTASRQPQLRDRAKLLGAAAFFEKPYEPEDLMAAVHDSLATTPCRQ